MCHVTTHSVKRPLVHETVSRTSTAPFDRLKVFLITRPPDLGGTSLHPDAGVRGAKEILSAIARIYAEGGIAAFWVGNGLSVAKIFPESAIKFLTYEASVCSSRSGSWCALNTTALETFFRSLCGQCRRYPRYQWDKPLLVRRHWRHYEPTK